MSSGSGCAERGIEQTILQTRIVSCRRSGLPERTVTADDAASPRAAGFAAFCSSWSLLKLATGGTEVDGRSGCGSSAGFAVSWTACDPLRGGVLRSSATRDLVAASGSAFSSRLSSATRSS